MRVIRSNTPSASVSSWFTSGRGNQVNRFYSPGKLHRQGGVHAQHSSLETIPSQEIQYGRAGGLYSGTGVSEAE